MCCISSSCQMIEHHLQIKSHGALSRLLKMAIVHILLHLCDDVGVCQIVFANMYGIRKTRCFLPIIVKIVPATNLVIGISAKIKIGKISRKTDTIVDGGG